jgi:YVTN family beta-propeller protein
MKPARHLFPVPVSCLFVCFVVASSSAAELATQLRRPIAILPSADSQRLFVANRDSGSISVIDIALGQVVAEHSIGKRLADLVSLPNSNQLLAVDEAAHELLLLQPGGDAIQVAQRLAVSPYPVSICVAPGGKQATIASLWSRRLTFVELGESLKIAGVLDLPFAPRCQLRLPSGQLLVADSFSGRLALVDPASKELVATREFPGHNIRGLGVSPGGEMLIVSHQMLNELAHSIRNDIHWGLLMSNDLRWLKVESVLAGGKSLYHGAHMHPLGESGKGGGDPGGVDVAANGTVCVAISGVDQVAIGKEGDFSMFRVNVGRRPTAVRIAQDGQTAFVANTFDDSISIVDLKGRKVAATISLGPQPELSLVQQGELLFHNAKLSHDGWMSCQSCHTDGHANGQMNDNFSDKSFGAPKRVPSLLGGVKDTLPLAWNGQVQTLARQIHNSVETTMQREDQLPQDQVQAIAAYVNSLERPPPLDELRGTQDAAAVERGRLVFEKRDCASCHAAPTYTTPTAYDVGLKDAQGNTEFNPPSLRGLSHRSPFFHDNSAATLEKVFLKRGHPSDAEYSAEEVKDLAAFLRSL